MFWINKPATTTAQKISKALTTAGQIVNDVSVAENIYSTAQLIIVLLFFIIFFGIILWIHFFHNPVTKAKIAKKNIEGFSCQGMDERDCNSSPMCSWCINSEGHGYCQHVDDSRRKCMSWTPGVTHPYTSSIRVSPNHYSYGHNYVPYFLRPFNWVRSLWGGWRPTRGFQKKMRRLSKGGW